MNRKNKTSFDKIQSAVSTFQTNVTATFYRFRQAEAQAKTDAEVYKDSEARYTAQRDALIDDARTSIQRAKEALSAAVQAETKELRKELSAHAATRPSTFLLDSLRTYRDFNLQPTRSDINALLDMAAGNTIGLRAINSTLEATKSPLRLSFPTVEAFEKDLEALETLADDAAGWSPIDFHHEACVVYDGQPRPNNPGCTLGSISLMIARSAYESKIKGLPAMAERWTSDVIPSIAQVKDPEYYKDSGEDGTVAEQYLSDREATGVSIEMEPSKAPAIEHAAEMGRQRAEADRRAREVIEQYRGM